MSHAWNPHRDTSDLANGCSALVVELACLLACRSPNVESSLRRSAGDLASGCFARRPGYLSSVVDGFLWLVGWRYLRCGLQRSTMQVTGIYTAGCRYLR